MGIQMWWVGQEKARSEATYVASNLVGALTVRRHFGGFSHLVGPWVVVAGLCRRNPQSKKPLMMGL
jgi:hypothetical protein